MGGLCLDSRTSAGIHLADGMVMRHESLGNQASCTQSAAAEKLRLCTKTKITSANCATKN